MKVYHDSSLFLEFSVIDREIRVHTHSTNTKKSKNIRTKSRLIICMCILYGLLIVILKRNQRPNSWTKSRYKFSSLLFTVTALPWEFYFFKLTQALTVSAIQLLYSNQIKSKSLFFFSSWVYSDA
jgi:hypothetical protein